MEYETDGPPDPLAPLSGVEIVDAVERDGVTYYALRDLRSQKLIVNVTRDTPERRWRYAIQQHEEHPVLPGHIRWRGDLGFLKGHKQRNGERRYNLAYRDEDRLRVFYGVDDDGIDDRWRAVLPVARH